MKANRKFLHGDDAVSPVIAVILMVAITVVLAATVYVWVSGFSANDSAQRTIALASAGAQTASGGDYQKSYTIASASPGLKYSELKLSVEGAEYTFTAATGITSGNTDEWEVSRSGTDLAGTALVTAGDTITLQDTATHVGSTLRVIDTASNSVIATLVVNT